jgi:hypothetical protein
MASDLDQAVAASGLSLRGAFHPEPADGVPEVEVGVPTKTLILLGWTGRSGYGAFAAAPEATDGAPHPLDRWSRRIVDGLACEFGARPLYPFGGPPYHPFQRWAARAEPLHPSPLGLFIHPRFGLWHSFRGALAFPVQRESEPQKMAPSPCASCETRPCLSACPVAAFSEAGYDVERCIGHLKTAAGVECRERGCLARRACPVGTEHAYGVPQAAFHMAAFLAAYP